jgi:hypothetical protein
MKKCEQQEDDSEKRSSSSGAKDTTEIPDKDKNNSNTPNQYVKDKNILKGEEELQADTELTHVF